MKRITAFLAILLFVIMIVGCATVQDRDTQGQFEITAAIMCKDAPTGYKEYIEKPDNCKG